LLEIRFNYSIMKALATIQFENSKPEVVKKFRFRKAVRAIIFDQDNKIGLLDVSKHNYHKLPGGGVKEGEDIFIALNRECLEEVGCKIEVIKDLGSIIEYRSQFSIKQESYCYLAKISGNKGRPDFTRREIEDGFKDKWIKLEQAIDLLENDKPDDYAGKFIRERDLIY